jgi:hypothetical protein
MAGKEKAAEVAVAMAHYRDHCFVDGIFVDQVKVKVSFVGTGERYGMVGS